MSLSELEISYVPYSQGCDIVTSTTEDKGAADIPDDLCENPNLLHEGGDSTSRKASLLSVVSLGARLLGLSSGGRRYSET